MEKREKSKGEHLYTTEKTPESTLPDSAAESNKSPKHDFPVVAIGASAGGLAAFEAFFPSCPRTPV